MPQFVVERDVPGAHQMSDAEVRDLARRSVEVLSELGPQIQWIQSYVTDDKIYCLYLAPDEDMVRTHAQKGGFPANTVARVRSVIDPATAEA